MTNDSIEPKKRVHYALNIKEDFSKMTPDQRKNAPICEVSSESVNFGEVQQNLTKTETISVRNNGKNPLIIRSLVSNNSLFSVSASEYEIPAGSSSVITITFRAPRRASTQNASFDIVTNDPANPVRTIPVTAKVL